MSERERERALAAMLGPHVIPLSSLKFRTLQKSHGHWFSVKVLLPTCCHRRPDFFSGGVGYGFNRKKDLGQVN